MLALAPAGADENVPVSRPTKVLRWGVLGAARIAVSRVLPAFDTAAHSRAVAIAARNPERAWSVAKAFGIRHVHSTYESLLADPQIDAVYVPLPNDLHVHWTIRALEAHKHVLCEKPIAMNCTEARLIADASRRTGYHVAEAYMMRFHPQWVRAAELVRSGTLGEIRAMQCWFAYDNPPGENLRNSVTHGGGALYDVGGYAIVAGRLLSGADPLRVIGLFDRRVPAGVDSMTSGLMEFPGGMQLAFGVSTGLVRLQSTTVYGSLGRMQVEVPFNPLPDRPSRLLIDDGRDLYGEGARVEIIPAADQYAVQLDAFSLAVLAGQSPPYGIEDAIENMRVLDALFRSERSGAWERP